MYQPIEFQDHDRERALEHIRRYPFGILFGSADGSYGAAHLPFQISEHSGSLVLEGHGAIRNGLLTGIQNGAEVLAVFSGPTAYVSPGVYRAEADVPTWNYAAVHVRGRYTRLPASENAALLERTVRHNESGEAGTQWSTSSMGREDLVSLARGVVSFSIEITGVEAGYKLSQDKLQSDIDAVQEHLSASVLGEANSVADAMRDAGVSGRTHPPTTDPANWIDKPSA